MVMNIFFKIKTGKLTRGHDFTLVKGQNRLDLRKYSISQRAVNEWNKWYGMVWYIYFFIDSTK